MMAMLNHLGHMVLFMGIVAKSG